MSPASNRNAQTGEFYEYLFQHLLETDHSILEAIVKEFDPGYPTSSVRLRIVEREGQHGEKSDVFIRASGGHNYGANIKSYRGSGFNQVTRTHIRNFSSRYELGSSIQTLLEELTVAKARNTRSKWIPDQHQQTIVEAISPKAMEILRGSLLGDDNPELFVLIKTDSRVVRIFRLEHLLQRCQETMNVAISPRGVIQLNPAFTIQRKGGNGRHETVPKDSIQHGGNNIQVKVKCERLAELATPFFEFTYPEEEVLVVGELMRMS